MATVKKVKKAQKGIKATADSTKYYKDQEKSYRTLSKSEKGDTEVSKFNKDFFDRAAGKAVSDQLRQYHKGSSGYDANGFPIKKKKSGGKVMLKRADGSVSQRGLWDNLRSAAKKNKAAGKPGKKPTAAMLKQEKKIKSQTKKK
jgi:hypothetical protein